MPKRVLDIDAIKVEKVLCVLLSPKSQPLPISYITECGVTCVPINSADPWLNKVLGDRCRGDAQLVVKQFVAEVFELLASQTKERSFVDDTKERSLVSEGGAPIEALIGRAAMGLDSDSDEEELALVPAEVVKPKRGRKLDKDKEFRTISIRGMDLTVKLRDKCKGIAVPLEGDTLLMILRHLREQVYAGEVPEPDPVKSARRHEVKGCKEDEDTGRVRWMYAECSYQIMFEDAVGKSHRVTTGLKVSRTDNVGALREPAAFQEARLRMLHKARALWNEEDKTDAVRYIAIQGVED